MDAVAWTKLNIPSLRQADCAALIVQDRPIHIEAYQAIEKLVVAALIHLASLSQISRRR